MATATKLDRRDQAQQDVEDAARYRHIVRHYALYQGDGRYHLNSPYLHGESWQAAIDRDIEAQTAKESNDGHGD